MTESELIRLLITQSPNFIGFIVLAVVVTYTNVRLLNVNERLTMRCLGVCDDETGKEASEGE